MLLQFSIKSTKSKVLMHFYIYLFNYGNEINLNWIMENISPIMLSQIKSSHKVKFQ